jgi:hypothetical protein
VRTTTPTWWLLRQLDRRLLQMRSCSPPPPSPAAQCLASIAARAASSRRVCSGRYTGGHTYSKNICVSSGRSLAYIYMAGHAGWGGRLRLLASSIGPTNLNYLDVDTPPSVSRVTNLTCVGANSISWPESRHCYLARLRPSERGGYDIYIDVDTDGVGGIVYLRIYILPLSHIIHCFWFPYRKFDPMQFIEN